MESILVRHENKRTIIFSRQKQHYLVPINQDSQEQLKKVLEQNKKGDWKTSANLDFVRDLERMGFDGKVRELFSEDSSYDLMAPLELYFDFTNKCNLRCNGCYNRYHIGNITMPPEKVRELIHETYSMGIMRLHLAGGEPTMEREGLLNYLGTSKELGLVTSMSTNGTLIDEDLCRKILIHNLFAFTVSIDGPNEQLNSQLRYANTFDKAIDALKIAKHIKQELGIDTRICMKSVCSPETSDETIENLVELGANLGLDEIKFYSPERSLNHERGYYGKSIERYYQMIQFMNKMKEKYSQVVKVSPVINPFIGGCLIGIPGLNGCLGANELLTINPDGSITPCLMMKQTLGNVYFTSLKDFWRNSIGLKKYRENTHSDECNECKIYSFCRGGCQVRKKVEYGKIEGVDPLCPKKYDSNLEPKILKTRGDLKFFKGIFNTHSL
jgi:radical SAM protein with 4Fe4S-binding SPASM domain